MESALVSVAVPLPFQAPFTYRMPPGSPVPDRGVRGLVPFAHRRVIGVVTGGAAAGTEGLKDVLEVVDEAPLVAPPLLDLAAWVAEHYLAPPGECYRLVLPPTGVRASRAVVRLVRPGERQEDPIVRALGDGPQRLSALGRRLGVEAPARVAPGGRVGIGRGRRVGAPGGLAPAVATRLEPTEDQEGALRPLCAAVEGGGFRPFLLHGITRSGKSEGDFPA